MKELVHIIVIITNGFYQNIHVLFYIKKRFGRLFGRMMVSECGQKTLGTNIGRNSHLDDSLELENNGQHSETKSS